MYLNELAYRNHITQTKRLAKDKKQNNEYHLTGLLDNDLDSDDVPEERLEALNSIEEEVDRRNGHDRRKAQQNRGRYVESRLNKNRRYKKEFSLVI